jgi:hypothetical protein
LPSRLRALALAALLAAAGLAGCDGGFDPPDTETPEGLAVLALLAAGDTAAYAYVARIAPPGLPPNEDTSYVNDADVRIGGVRLDAVTPRQLRDGAPFDEAANYRAAPFAVAPGATYTLDVDAGDARVTGTATVPRPVTVSADGRRLSWTRSDGAALYRVLVDGVLPPASATRDTTLLVVPDPDFGGGPRFVRVQALDPHLTVFTADRLPQAGLEGALGVFGAFAQTDTVLVLSGR